MDVSYWPEMGAQHHLGLETTAFHQTEYPGDLRCFFNDCTSNANPTLLDVFREPVDQDDQVFDVDNGIEYSGNLLSCSPAPITQPEYVTPSNGVECYATYPKRIKTTSGLSCSYDSGKLTENPYCYGVDEFLPALQQFPVDNFQGTLPEWTEKAPMSTQTVAARLRRKKISDKTLELGRLVPGGAKMNTADMYLAAFKYVKLMEAQIGVLKLMVSIRVLISLKLL